MFLKYSLSILIPLALSALISFLLNAYTPVSSPHWGYGLLFFAALCFILNLVYWLNAASKAITELLMAGIVIRLLLSLSFIVVYSVVNRPGLFHFAMHFIVYYILFTIFEIRYLLDLIKIKNQK